MSSDAVLRAVADRQAITDKIYRYCRSVDRCDPQVGHAVFHPDSKADFPSYTGTGRGWIDFICVEHKKFLHHSHQVTNVIIELDEDQAGSESYVFATLRSEDRGQIFEHRFWARYFDKWSKRDGDWAIDERVCLVDFGSSGEVSAIEPDPRGRRDSQDLSYKVLKG